MSLEEIAAKLTKAQREALLDMRGKYAKHFSGSPATLHALARKGLSEGKFADTPTEDGLAVHYYLKEQRNG